MKIIYISIIAVFEIHPSMHASMATKLAPTVVLPPNAVWFRRRFRKPANVHLASFISKNRLNRQNDNRIQAAQNARRPACLWLVVADVLFLSLLGRLSFVLYVAHLPA